MWSASGLLGSRPASQVRRTWQMGQCSSPAARAERLAAAALWSQRVVPVREVVTCPPRARVRTRAATCCCARAARVASPHSLLPRRVGSSGAQHLVGGWALTLCLCSYDACFSSSVQVGVASGVLRFGHGVGVLLLWGTPIADAPAPVLLPPPPCLMGVPLAFEGGGVLVIGPRLCGSTPLCCGLPRCLHTPPRLACIQYVGIH